jgi:zinc/manganese transport system substrate-binding protein
MRHRTILTLVALLALTSCSSSEPEEGLTVVATTTVLGDVVSSIVGDDGEVDVLIDGQADPHEFSPSAAETATVLSADLVVANGLDLEAGALSLLESAEEEGIPVLYLAPQLDPIPFGGGEHEHEEDEEEEEHEHEDEEDHEHEDEEDHDHTGDDPHFWLDPLRMADATGLIASALDEVTPSTDWAERAGSVRAELEELHSEIADVLGPIPEDRRKLVTNHDSLGYLADRYGFEVVSTVIPGGSTMGEPSASDLAELVDLLRAEDIRAIFADTTSPRTLAEAVAAELGDSVQIYDLYTGALGEPGSGADTYAGMMRTNANTIAEALSR